MLERITLTTTPATILDTLLRWRQGFHQFLEPIAPWLPWFGAGFAWIFLLVLARSLWGTASAIVRRSQELHQIPCANCVFFTDNHRLKCTIDPISAGSELAIDCLHYQPQVSGYSISIDKS